MFKPVLALPLVMQLVSVADGVPNLDVTTSCRGAARAVAQSESEKREKACYESEKMTKEKLQQNWASFPAKDRNFCLGAVKGYAPTYTELSTCLEMIRDVRNIGQKPAESPVPTPRAPRRGARKHLQTPLRKRKTLSPVRRGEAQAKSAMRSAADAHAAIAVPHRAADHDRPADHHRRADAARSAGTGRGVRGASPGRSRPPP